MNANTLCDTTVATLPAHDPSAIRPAGWLTRFFDQLESWSNALRMREVEAYLAQAQDAADLQHRMNRVQDARRSQALLLR